MSTAIVIAVYVVIIASFAFDWWLSRLNYNNQNAPIPEVVNDIYGETEYKRWQAYTMENHKFSNISKIVTQVVFLILLVSGAFVVFQGWAEQLTNHVPLQVVYFMAPYFIISRIIGIPFSYYDTFVIEEKYGFNKATKKTFVLDKIKGIILTIIFGGGLLYLIGTIQFHMNSGMTFFIVTWLSLMVIFFLIMILYVPVFVPLFNKLSPLEDGELKIMITSFANSVGYEISKISVIDASKRSSRLNAFFSGMGKFKQIVLYDTLIEKMSNEEIVAVLAHEIGHNKHKHVISGLFERGITLFIYVGLLMLVLNEAIFSTAFGFDAASIGFSLVLFIVLLEPISILINLVSAGISRKHEYQADAYASTKFKKEPMITALKVLSKENFSNLTPHPLYVKLRYSHPPTADRINAIMEL